MEQARLVIAIVLSVLIFLAWQFFFVDKKAIQKPDQKAQQPPANVEQVKKAQPYTKETRVVEPDKTGVAATPVSTPPGCSTAVSMALTFTPSLLGLASCGLSDNLGHATLSSATTKPF